MVPSLAHPSGNLTGVSSLDELTSKRVELLSDLVPGAGVIGLIVNPNNLTAEQQMRHVREAAQQRCPPTSSRLVEVPDSCPTRPT